MWYNFYLMRTALQTVFAYCLISTVACAAVAPHAKFEDGMLSKTRPAGWLQGACRLQAEGLTGHPEALSYPYDTCLWAGTIPRMGTHGQDWWRYEQTAYYTDGLLRLGYALGDKTFIEKGEAGVNWTLDNVSPEGYLGNACLWDAKNFKLKKGYDMWPFAVFFRAMKAKYDATPDERIPVALARYFLLYSKEHVSETRNVVNVEGILWAYSHTGDKKLLELAEEAWCMRKPLPPESKNELAPKNCANNDAIHMHGVSYCEEMKVPTVARITAAADAKPGIYNFGPLKVTVLNRVLPPAKDWKYFLDLWQHPWAVSRYFNVEPFSKEHYAKMEPIYRTLAECGCKALTTTLLDLPWNHQCYDGYYSMIGRVKKADGSWVFDYKLFDEYVEFGRKCGLGPDIACYTMCPWKYMATWKEEVTGNGERIPRAKRVAEGDALAGVGMGNGSRRRLRRLPSATTSSRPCATRALILADSAARLNHL